MKQVNFLIDDKLHYDFKKYCFDNSTTITQRLIRHIKNDIKINDLSKGGSVDREFREDS